MREGKTMTELAHSLYVTPQTVFYWNQGRAFPRLEMLVNILDKLNCRFEDLVETLNDYG